MSHTTLISVDQLRRLDRVVVLDCGFDITDASAGARAHAQGHIPGAHYAHLDHDLAGPTNGSNGRHPLPTRAAFAATVARWGVRPDVQVVCYDAQGSPYAARAWWMLQWLGHKASAVLDGGLQAWKAAGLPLSADTAPLHEQAPYPFSDTAMPTIDADTLLTKLGRVLLIDARAGDRFRGENETLDPVGGHIAGASHRFFKDNLGADGRFKPATELRAVFEALGAGANAQAPVVHQCGSGVTACHNLLAMTHAGLAPGALYAGSWSEWCADPSRPIATG